MAREDVELVRSLYAAMNQRDRSAAAKLLHADAEWVPDERVGEAPVRGRDEVLEFFADRAEMFDQMRVEQEGIRENEGKVVALIRVLGRGHASGAEFDIRIGHVWTIRDGVIVRGEGFGDREKALEAAGVPE
jgi:ketosteroid isomerase-like protein